MELALESYFDSLRISERNNKRYIYDPVRQRDIVLQPEELVRQVWIAFLIQEKGISPKSLAIEKQLKIDGLNRRFDLIYYNKGRPHILFEFKSFKIDISDSVALQAAFYNKRLEAPYLILSNGSTHLGFKVDHSTDSQYKIPTFKSIGL